MILLELPPDLEARLAAEAKARGLDVAAYAARVLAEAVPVSTVRTFAVGGSRTVEHAGTPAKEPKPQPVEDGYAWLDQLGQFSNKIPAMPGETFSREMIYHDHD